jgi:uncharacterized damage-inducible protein DinB
MNKIFLSLFLLASSAAAPVFAQQEDIKPTILKHLKTSRDFTLKVAEAMPEADYGFKLTPTQMSFGAQLTHIAQGFTYFLSPFTGQKPNPAKPASESKADVIAFIKSSYDQAIDGVSKLTPEQLSKTYKSEEGSETGLELLMGMLDHATHHRASAEMYLRAKGIKPPEYQT